MFHVIRAMRTDKEWREEFLNIGPNPWEQEANPTYLLKGSFQTGDLRPLVDHYWTTTRKIPEISFILGENSMELNRVKRFIFGTAMFAGGVLVTKLDCLP